MLLIASSYFGESSFVLLIIMVLFYLTAVVIRWQTRTHSNNHKKPVYTKRLKAATGKFLPNLFLANSPSTSRGLRGFKSLDLYNIWFTEYILCRFDHV